MDVSIIIVNYNTRELTSNCVNSIIDETKNVSFEIILVDNASLDGSKEFFENDNRIHYIYNKENVGFGRANNIGYHEAKGKYLFLLNSDTILKNNAVFIFYEAMERLDNNVACIGAQLIDKDGNATKSFGPYFSFNVLFPHHVNQIFIDDIPPFGKTVPVVIGADMFIRKEIADKYGLFDPIFFMYEEENDMQRRYASKGYVSKIIGGPQIVHLEGKSNKFRLNAHMIGGAYTYMKKWSPRWKYWAFRLLYSLTRSVKVLLTHYNMKEKLKYLRVLFFYRVSKI